MFTAIFILSLNGFDRPLKAHAAIGSLKPICQNKIQVDGPAIVDATVGTIRLYTVRQGFAKLKDRLQQSLGGQSAFEYFEGFSGMRYFINNADASFLWENGDSLASVGLFRDFKASPQQVVNPYCVDLKGQRANGWLTIVAFDGTIIDRKSRSAASETRSWMTDGKSYRATATAKVIDEDSATVEVRVWRGSRQVGADLVVLPGHLQPSTKTGDCLQLDSLPTAGGGQLLITNVSVPNWTYTAIWLWTDRFSTPIWLSHRDTWPKLIKFHRRKGRVESFTLFDRWIGGPQPKLDRREGVSTYRIMGSKLVQVSERIRLVPNDGGGKDEKRFRWETGSTLSRSKASFS